MPVLLSVQIYNNKVSEGNKIVKRGLSKIGIVPISITFHQCGPRFESWIKDITGLRFLVQL